MQLIPGGYCGSAPLHSMIKSGEGSVLCAALEFLGIELVNYM